MTGSNTQLIADCQTELDNIRNHITSNPFDSMVRFLVSYSVIKSCGTIEIVFKDIIYNHLIQNANPEAVSYLSKHVKDSSINPKTGKISKILEDINPAWKSSFEAQLQGSNDKVLLNSLVDLRNSFAHGNPITASIDDVIQSFTSGCNILNILDSIVQ